MFQGKQPSALFASQCVSSSIKRDLAIWSLLKDVIALL